MQQTTPQWPDSSSEFAHFSPRPSGLVRWWWGLLHGLAVLAIVIAALPLWWQGLAVAGILVHARWRRPPPVPCFEQVRPGCWSVPGLDRHELALAPRSRCGGWWIRLVLEDSQGSLEWTLYRDQLPPQCWRALAGAVRDAMCGAADVRVRMR